jgi:hypothetical protein
MFLFHSLQITIKLVIAKPIASRRCWLWHGEKFGTFTIFSCSCSIHLSITYLGIQFGKINDNFITKALQL